MENWERVTKLATVATDSNGYALEKFNVYQESTAAKMAEFQNQFQILSSTIWDSELIKGSIDTGTGFLGILTGIIDTLGTIPALATVAAGALSFGNKGWLTIVERQVFKNKYAQPLLKFVETQANVGHVLKYEERSIGLQSLLAG